MGWLGVDGGYEVTVRGGAVVCRDASGRVLESVPWFVETDPVAVGLYRIVDWLTGHAGRCRDEVEAWMIGSQPLDPGMLTRLWADEAWRAALTGLVVSSADTTGLLHDVGERGIEVTGLGGGRRRMAVDRLTIPHPVLLPDLPAWQALATGTGLRQPVEQLFRRTFTRPPGLDPAARAFDGYAGGGVLAVREVAGWARSLGYAVHGGAATCPVPEAGRQVEAQYWIGWDDPWRPETGELVFVADAADLLCLGDVGPVAWSEGVRMAARVHAARPGRTREGG